MDDVKSIRYSLKTADIGLATAMGCNTGQPAVAADISTQGHESTGKFARRVSIINVSIAQWETARNGTCNWRCGKAVRQRPRQLFVSLT